MVTDADDNVIRSTSFSYDEDGDETGENDGGVLTTVDSYDGGEVTLQAVLDATDATVNWQSFSYDKEGDTTRRSTRRRDDESTVTTAAI